MAEQTKNGAFRKKKIYFTQVSNKVSRDRTLSLKAKGLYTLIQGYITIEGFTLYKDTLKKECKEGTKSFDSAWKELKDHGLLVQYKLKDEKGKIYYEYDLLDEKPTTENKENIQPIENTNDNPHPQKGGYGKCSCGKGGVFNNTDLNNTYSMYVCMYQKHLKISKEVEVFLANNEIDKRIDIDLFEKVLVEVMNNNKVKSKDNYFLKKLINLCNKGIKTIEQYKADTEAYKQKNINNKRNKETNHAPKNTIKSIPVKRTENWNIKESFRNYTADELEEILRESQKGKF